MSAAARVRMAMERPSYGLPATTTSETFGEYA